MLPYPALVAIAENLDHYSMALYMSLAQVNRQWRSVFLSNYLWARFDVHQVAGSAQVYTYKNYQLHGIAAHYFNYLAELDQRRRAWHVLVEPSPIYTFSSEPRPPFIDLKGCRDWINLEPIPTLLDTTEPYDQMQLVCSLWSRRKMRLGYVYSLPPRNSVSIISRAVWELSRKFPNLMQG